jgi:aspartate oxidase
METLRADVLVAGGGAAGALASYRALNAGARVILLGGSAGASQRISSMNTALGYDEQDTPAGILDDMLRAGGHVNNLAFVAALAARIGPETRAMEQLGVPFIRQGEGLARRRAAGSSRPRAVFTEVMVGADIVERVLAACSSFEGFVHLRGARLVDLAVGPGGIRESLIFSTRDDTWFAVRAPAVVLATGGAGQVFATTTNPAGSRGLGYAVALEAGADLVDMEFVSFEPFITSAPDHAKGHDLPTTILTEGALLRNGRGTEFLDTAAAPTKDVICRAMVREVLEGRGTPSGSVYFDLREMNPEVAHSYLQIQQALRPLGIRSTDALLEVMPAQHYLMGGVKVNESAATSVPGLFAVGETAGGAHGAHRLAAAGGLEAVAGGAIAGESAAAYASQHGPDTQGTGLGPRPDLLGTSLSPRAKAAIERLRAAMDAGCGILRHADELRDAETVVAGVLEEASRIDEPYVRRQATVGLSIIRSAQSREESRGDHSRLDFPDRDDTRWLCNLRVVLDAEGVPVADRIGLVQPAG